MGLTWKCWMSWWWGTQTLVLICLRNRVNGQIGYSVMEELEKGTAVGNLAHDLQMDPRSLFNRKFQINYDTKTQYFDINTKNGMLYISNKIDREELCGSSVTCEIKLGIVLDKPLEVFQIEIQVLDMNDNSPVFPEDINILKIVESSVPGAQFPLEAAYDPDVGSNSLCLYDLSPKDLFSIESPSKDNKSKSLVLVLNQALDREKQASHLLTLTAADCGTPKRSGTTQIRILVQDVNDNAPTFRHPIYRVSIPENYAVGSLIVVLKATDLDEGENGVIEYSFSSIGSRSVKQLFKIEKNNGEVHLKGLLDYENKKYYEIHVQAKDTAQLPMTGHCKVIVDVTDVNDNPPEIKISSLSGAVKEDSSPGFVIALFTVTDRDSGPNGQVRCQIPDNLPFYLDSKFSNYYSLVLKDNLDRESVAEYNVPISATDNGIPALSTTAYIYFSVDDINDNPPLFTEELYFFSIAENILPGSLIFQVSASDKDSGKNAQLLYALLESYVEGMSVSHFISINPDSGNVFSVDSFDYEKMQMFQLQVEVKDHGLPSLSNTANITVFIQDQNDHSPEVLSPVPTSEMVLRSMKVGHLVTKLRAVDADAGYNAWLTYEMDPVSNTTLFSVDSYSGEIRIARNIKETEENMHKLVVIVRDHGQPSKSTLATIMINIVETSEGKNNDYIMVVKSEHQTTGPAEHLIIAAAVMFSTLVFIFIFYKGFQFYMVFKDMDRQHRTEDFEYVRNDWTLLEHQKCKIPLYFTSRSDNNATLTLHRTSCSTSDRRIAEQLVLDNNQQGETSRDFEVG
eukprot:XP_012815600.1 PREDICTED: protocadherin alpha-13-like [Xenopus tropicalis]